MLVTASVYARASNCSILSCAYSVVRAARCPWFSVYGGQGPHGQKPCHRHQQDGGRDGGFDQVVPVSDRTRVAIDPREVAPGSLRDPRRRRRWRRAPEAVIPVAESVAPYTAVPSVR